MPDLHPTPGPWKWSFWRLDPKHPSLRVGLKGPSGATVVDVGCADDDCEIGIDNESDARVIAYAAPLYHAAARLARARTLVEQTAAWEEVVRVVGEVEGSAP